MRFTITLLSFGLLILGIEACKPTIDPNKQDLNWWKTSVIYQIYPRSFKDSDGDGIGDLNGITSKLEHIKEAGADAFWLSPIYKSPQKDFGYDIANYTDVNPEYGTLADFDRLVKKAKELGLKVILDFVPNHTSDESEWFKKSIDKIKPYDNFYIWKDAKKGTNGKRLPPNNWLSSFGGSAWEWNAKREQYYYHAFAPGQPDLNYRSTELDHEMKNVLSFWMKRGVDGFRVDVVNHMFEDDKFLDEPKSNNNVPPEDYDYLDHIYTRDLDQNYDVVKSWMKLLDYHVLNYRSNGKMMILEAYTSIPNSMKYYTVGANPFNFMFVASLNKDSQAIDFKKSIDEWMDSVPKSNVSNWVVGNHDQHRVATRYGEGREDQITMISSVLPGITVVYNGDEIGMIDRPFTWEETVDPAGCLAGEDRYELKSRDPERTPYQWDDTTSAGFSTTEETWLPVHSNYKTLNLAAQKKADVSHYKVFQALMKLKKNPVVLKGETEVVLNEYGNVLAIIRKLEESNQTKFVVLLINFSNQQQEVDATNFDIDIPAKLKIYTASAKSKLKVGQEIDTDNVVLPKAASVILA